MLFTLVCVLLLLCLNSQTSAQNEGLSFSKCDYSANFTSNSSFSTTLTQAFKDLISIAPDNGFGAVTTGATDPVTALALCRGTLNREDCNHCIDNAISDLRRDCPNQKSAQVWYSSCMVRYSKHDFTNDADLDIMVGYADSHQADNPEEYFDTIKYLLRNLSSAAIESDNFYALGQTTYYLNTTVYGYVECTRDLLTSSCSLCLEAAIKGINSCCIATLFGFIATPSCNIKFGTLPMYNDWPDSPLVLPLPPPTPPPPPPPFFVSPSPPLPRVAGDGGARWRAVLVIGGLVGVVVVVVVVVGVLWMVMERRRKRTEREYAEEMMKREGIGLRPFIYDYHVLAVATHKFSTLNLLGNGGFGTVYKGSMPNGQEIAVKKLAIGSVQGIGEFFNEVHLLLKMQHRNLVRLYGCCVEGDERILVYEYLENKSLDRILFNKRESGLLNWAQRFNIILGVARGLLYLHEDSTLKIIHRDVKASNILLDGQMNPKLSDFGLAKLFLHEQSHLRTNQIAGTSGYMAPEYANQGFLSTKSDVFSFGVLILEIVSGRKNYDGHLDIEQKELLTLAWRLEQQGKLIELVDTTICPSPQDKVLRCMHIGLMCCQERVEDRPTMSSTLEMLSNDNVVELSTHRTEYHTSNRVGDDEAVASSNSDPSNPISNPITLLGDGR